MKIATKILSYLITIMALLLPGALNAQVMEYYQTDPEMENHFYVPYEHEAPYPTPVSSVYAYPYVFPYRLANEVMVLDTEYPRVNIYCHNYVAAYHTRYCEPFRRCYWHMGTRYCVRKHLCYFIPHYQTRCFPNRSWNRGLPPLY